MTAYQQVCAVFVFSAMLATLFALPAGAAEDARSLHRHGAMGSASAPPPPFVATTAKPFAVNSVVLDAPASPALLYTLHMPPKAIGEITGDSHAKRLLLSHLSPSVEGAHAAVEASIAQRYKGPITIARDGLRTVP